MNPYRENISTGEGDDSLSRYLKPDTPEVKEIEDLHEKEYEYGDYLGEVEYSISRHFYEADRKIKDKDVVSALKNIRKNFGKNISFFKLDLEKEILETMIELMEEEPITHHEFRLVIDYVLETIENRSWMEDEQAYVKWAAYMMGFYNEEEKVEYEESVKKLASRLGLSSKHVDLMLMKGEEEEDYLEFFEELGEEEELRAEMESKFLSLPDAEKFDFLLENGPEFYELLGLYISELSEKGELEKIQELYDRLIEKYGEHIYLYAAMGGVYLDRDPALAKSYYEKALAVLDKLEDLPDSMKEELRDSLSILIMKIS
ncbi:hypothetical protein FTO70_10945 [Methanosarcina sp. KYL-1]|uniref:hypothetical protein n=1 Tax=Methanosarcina sp. KYL-1 TaxID=2602068 RepID=UPI0021015DD3|nr:hypothetical protein [Methanosarcina sp. KYL-1]MCQ1536186.1 hypothetical protein [Methanosarcina sp. KYL-1]